MIHPHSETSAILLIHCPDQKGIVAAVTEFLFKNKGNIISLDQHIDHQNKMFFMRVQWAIGEFLIPREKIDEYFKTLIGDRFGMTWSVYFSDQRPRMALFVSKLSHCLFDVLSRWSSGELQVDIPLMIGNHTTLEKVANRFEIPFHYFEITTSNKAEQEKTQLTLLKENGVDLVVLARYMQILSPEFIKQYTHNIINIHHSFLPAFPGAKPYHSAFERGVKIIGATSHYVTEELDAGPIIEQDVSRVNHGRSVDEFIRKGQDLEKVVLSRAVFNHIERRILVFGNRTVVFE